jgi:hypothetical protein
MRPASWLVVAAVLFGSPLALAASKDNEQPDKEMLQMMDLLRDMEMIRRIDMMQDMAEVEQAGDQIKGTNLPKSAPKNKKEITK